MKRNITIVEEQLNDALSISDEKISLQKQLQQEKYFNIFNYMFYF